MRGATSTWHPAFVSDNGSVRYQDRICQRFEDQRGVGTEATQDMEECHMTETLMLGFYRIFYWPSSRPVFFVRHSLCHDALRPSRHRVNSNQGRWPCADLRPALFSPLSVLYPHCSRMRSKTSRSGNLCLPTYSYNIIISVR